MIIATPSQSIAGTEAYFDQVLTKGDYYLEDQEVSGTWRGKAASLLGLKAGTTVTKEGFGNLLRGLHPVSGEKLVQRVRKDRRPGVDFTFSVKKSVSLAWAINKDERILDALGRAVNATITKDVEPLVCRRVREGKHASSTQRTKTGNLIYADFLHKTSRPVDGIADPHLHVHAFVINHTTDGDKHYAAEFEEVFNQLPSLQAKFDARLIAELRSLGYEVEAARQGRKKASWELKIEGTDRTTIEKFSRRTAQVEAYADEHGIEGANAKAKLGLTTREAKDKGASIADLRRQWRARLTPGEERAFAALEQSVAGAIGGEGTENLKARIDAAVEFSLQHHLYRQSTVEKHTVVGTALEHGLTLLPEQIEAALAREDIIHREQDVRGADREFLTTREVLEAESRMIEFAREGRGTRYSIARSEHTFEREWLNEEQKNAVNEVLFSRDTVTAITGGAGTGKTSLMQEAVEAIRNNGKEVFVVAPTTGAREVLEESGFTNSVTVEHLLRNEKLHAELKDQVIWVDEGAFLDVRTMNALFEVTDKQNARVVLAGDTRQNSSPRRGEAMRILQAEAGLNVARVDKIHRQRGQYKRAVELISQGQTVVDPKQSTTGLLAGFDLLDRLGKVKEITSDNRYAILAEQYLAADKSKHPPLVVAPTHAEGRQVTAYIRDRLSEAGAIGDKSREFMRLQALNFTEAEKSTIKSYDADGMIVQFHQNVAGGYKRGERYRVEQDQHGSLVLQSDAAKTTKPIPLAAADRFEVYQEANVEFAVGDKVRFSLGGKATDGKRQISNGRLDEVAGFDRQGNVKLKSGMKVRPDYGHWDLGYCVTSHSAQGKQAKTAIAAMGSMSLPAINAKQLYVTASRGQDNVTIYVDDKAAVRRSIQRSGDQLSATELVYGSAQREQHSVERRQQHRLFLDRVRDWWQANWQRRAASTSRIKSAPREYSPSPELGRS